MDAKEILTEIYYKLLALTTSLERLLTNARNPGEEADG